MKELGFIRTIGLEYLGCDVAKHRMKSAALSFFEELPFAHTVLMRTRTPFQVPIPYSLLTMKIVPGTDKLITDASGQHPASIVDADDLQVCSYELLNRFE